MNNFDLNFFKKFTPEGQGIKYIIHMHMIVILKKLFLTLGLFLIIPTILYYKSQTLQSLIPFFYFEIYVIILYIKIMYDIFDWYNDVWIVTCSGIVSVKWSLFKTSSDTLGFEHIEGVGVEKNSIFDMFFKKGDLVAHKFGDEVFVLENATKPYKAVNLIESIKPENEDTNINDERFNQILQTLSGVVSNNTEKDMKGIGNENEKLEYIEKARKSEGVIDLSS